MFIGNGVPDHNVRFHTWTKLTRNHLGLKFHKVCNRDCNGLTIFQLTEDLKNCISKYSSAIIHILWCYKLQSMKAFTHIKLWPLSFMLCLSWYLYGAVTSLRPVLHKLVYFLVANTFNDISSHWAVYFWQVSFKTQACLRIRCWRSLISLM